MSLFDENQRVLNDLARRGVDLGFARPVEFTCIFPIRPAAELFERAVRQEGFSTVARFAKSEDFPWEVIATMTMKPTCENITSAETRLAAVSQSNGGSTDGWGFYEAET